MVSRHLRILVFLALQSAVVAHADTPLTLRKAWAGPVDYFATGAAMAANGPGGTKVFAQPATVLVTATDVPANAIPLTVYVYWAGTVNGTNCGGFTIDRDVEVIPPGWTRGPVRVVADECFCSVGVSGGATPYDVQACRADITQITNDAGAGLLGTWSVSGFIARLTTGSTDNASFSLVMAYKSVGLKPRRVADYDGLVTFSLNSSAVTLSGLKIDNPAQGDLTFYALDGDVGSGGSTGEQVAVRGIPGAKRILLQDSVNPVDNPMNSTINTVKPPQVDTVGVDIDQFDISGALSPDDASVEMTYGASSDKWWLVYNLVGVNVYEAALAAGSSLTWALVDDPDGNHVPSPGDTIHVEMTLLNGGSGIGRVKVNGAIPPEAAQWRVTQSGSGVDTSNGNTLVLTNVQVPIGGATLVGYDWVIDDIPDVTVVKQALAFDSRPDGDIGTVNASDLLIRRDGDHDGKFDRQDNCPDHANPSQTDADADGKGDACDPCPNDATDDGDDDGVCEDVDDCPGKANPDQRDLDHDGKGDACDACPRDVTNDPDADTICEDVDNCPGISNPGQEDADRDGFGDACDPCPQDKVNDADLDGICESRDNCPGIPNPSQLDFDKDATGDSCDACPKDPLDDADDDGLCADFDNCAVFNNTDQKDVDGDGLGDVCDACPLDPLNDRDQDQRCANVDNCPTQFNPDQLDTDRDGKGDECDVCKTDPNDVQDDRGRCKAELVDLLKVEDGCNCGGGSADLLGFAVIGLLALLRRRRGAGLGITALVVLGCPSPPPAPTLESIVLNPPTAMLPKGGTATFTAKSLFSDSTEVDSTATVVWSVSVTDAAEVNAGTLKVLKEGELDVVATDGAVAGKAHVIVGPATATSVTVSPASATMAAGTSQLFTANAVFTDDSSGDVTSRAVWTTGDAAVAEVLATGELKAKAIGRTTVTATLDGAVGVARVVVTAALLRKIELAPATVELPVGLVQEFTATGIFSDATTQPLTPVAKWTSSDPLLADVTNSPSSRGKLTALKIGQVTVKASYGGIDGVAEVVVKDAEVETLEVAPITASIANGTTQQFSAIARLSDGSRRDVSADAVWTASDETIAVAADATKPGLFKGISLGTTEVTASLAGKTAKATLDVTATRLASVDVTPNDLEMPKGLVRTFKAVATFTDGTTQDVTANAWWTSADASVAAVTNAPSDKGSVTAMAIGNTTISARFQSQSDSTTVTVTPAAITKLEVSPATASGRVALTTAFTATGIYTDGAREALTTGVTWNSTDETVATISNADASRGIATALKGGTTTIGAIREGASGTAVFTVAPATLDTIEVAPATASVALGRAQQFTATGVYSDAFRQPFTKVATWAAETETIATVSNAPETAGLARSVGIGTTPVKATFFQVTGTASLQVTPAVLVSLTVSPATERVEIAGMKPFEAIGEYSDGTRRNLTTSVTWSSTVPAKATISGGVGTEGQATGVALGQTTIRAEFEGVSATAILNVVPRIPSTLVITPATPTVRVGATVQLIVTATYADSSSEVVTDQADWTTSSATKATVSTTGTGRGLVTGKAVGTVTITATYSATPATIDVVVQPPTLTSIAVTPTVVSLGLNGTRQLAVAAKYSDNSTVDVTSTATYTSGAETIATVSAGGLVTGLLSGSAVITVGFQGQSATAAVTVSGICTKTPVINEVQTGAISSSGTTLAANEWIELFNPCPAGSTPIDLATYKLTYVSSGGTSLTVVDFSVGGSPTSIAAQGYIVAYQSGTGGPTIPSPKPANYVGFTQGLSGTAGSAVLKSGSTTVDVVGWGGASSTAIEGTAATPPGDATIPGTSTARIPDGTDTNVNSADFKTTKKPTPGAANELVQ